MHMFVFVCVILSVAHILFLVKQATTRTRSNTNNLKRFGDKDFCAYAPRLWNELPDNIKAADSVQNFKTQLETLLFD